MTPASHNSGARKNRQVLGNCSINKFPRQRTRDATTEKLLEAVFSMRSVPRLYSESRPGQLYTWVSKNPSTKHGALAFSTSLIKLIASFLTNRKCKVFEEVEFSTPRNIAVGLPQGSVLAPIL
jgi:hypothetical protein